MLRIGSVPVGVQNYVFKIRYLGFFFLLIFPCLTLAFAQADSSSVKAAPLRAASADAGEGSRELIAAENQSYGQLVAAIRRAKEESHKRVQEAVNDEKVREAWEIGKLVNDHILLHKDRADYGKRILPRLASDIEIGETELKYMVQFARTYPISRPADKLSWSHYQALLSLNDDKEREEVTKLAVEESWTRERVREEVQKRRNPSQAPAEKLTAAPGIPGVYRLVTAPEGPYKGQLVMDLGFSNYFKFGNMNEFKAGDLVSAAPVKQSKKGLATRFHFKRVLPKSYLEKTHLVVGSQYVIADESSLYTYRAYVTEVIDGDTFKAVIDLGFGFVTKQKLRLRALDAPEVQSSSGAEAKAFLASKLLGAEMKAKKAPEVIIKTVKSDKYDRYLADVWADGKYVNQALIEQDLAAIVTE